MIDIFIGIKALVIIVSIFAISDIISIKSKGAFSIMFTSTILFVIAFINGLPTDIFITAELYKIGNILVSILIVHLGTTLNINSLKKQWKVIVIAISAEIGIIIFILSCGVLFYDFKTALSSISPIGGGVVATLIVHKTAELNNLNDLIIFTTLLLSASSFVGYPIASFFLRKEAKNILKNSINTDENISNSSNDFETIFKFSFLKRFSEKYTSPLIIFAKLVVVAFISLLISRFTNDYINEFILCLVLGFLFKEVGFLDFDSLNKANSYGFTMIAVFTVIFQRFSTISVEIILQLLIPIFYFLFLGVIGMIVTSLIVGKKLKYSKYMSISIGVSCMFGFPGTYIIPHEVAKSVGKTKSEQELILKGIYPQMLISGFVNVTIASVIISSIIINFI